MKNKIPRDDRGSDRRAGASGDEGEGSGRVDLEKKRSPGLLRRSRKSYESLSMPWVREVTLSLGLLHDGGGADGHDAAGAR